MLQKESSTAASASAGIPCTVDQNAIVRGFTFEDAIAVLAGSCIILGLFATSVDMLTDPYVGLKIRHTSIIDMLCSYFGLVLGCIDADLCKEIVNTCKY